MFDVNIDTKLPEAFASRAGDFANLWLDSSFLAPKMGSTRTSSAEDLSREGLLSARHSPASALLPSPSDRLLSATSAARQSPPFLQSSFRSEHRSDQSILSEESRATSSGQTAELPELYGLSSGPPQQQVSVPTSDQLEQQAHSGELQGQQESDASLDKRERNRKAQRSYRSRLKARTEQQSEQIQLYEARIAVLESRLRDLEHLSSRPSQPSPPPLQRLDAAHTELESATELFRMLTGSDPHRDVLATSGSLQLERGALQTRAQQVESVILMISRASALTGPQRDQEVCKISVELGRLNGLQPVSLALARSKHLQELNPSLQWQQAFPMPVESLYGALHSGSLEHRILLTVGPLAGRHVSFQEIASLLPSVAFAWWAQYIEIIGQLLQQWPRPMHQLERAVAEWCIVRAIMNDVTPWGIMSSLDQHHHQSNLRAPEGHHRHCLAACRMTRIQQVSASEIVHDFLREQQDLARQQRLLINAIGDATKPKTPPLQSGQEQAEFLVRLSNLHENLALQHENRQHMSRRFIYSVLTPLQVADMLLASSPYILNISAVLCSPLRNIAPFCQ